MFFLDLRVGVYKNPFYALSVYDNGIGVYSTDFLMTVLLQQYSDLYVDDIAHPFLDFKTLFFFADIKDDGLDKRSLFGDSSLMQSA